MQEYLVPNRLQKGGLDFVGAVSLLKFWYATVIFFNAKCKIFGNNVPVTLFQMNTPVSLSGSI